MKTWKARVRKVYASLDELRVYDSCYNIVRRCGYKSAEALWRTNPVIGGSVYPDDFGKVGERNDSNE